ncbi:sodium-dependent glucose transporter 1A-like protein [Leptotrombidium deliense]|uniref:Sodium-dependent glucose transporter 1A-like protein n=1 Tax=Leptotrombidium deliense TaxID=299467 RepID=A0A443S919_9ACAR|nr:sodium-dependent glucose transporter 1A-like protein [Leptotrombidium deliense]
MNVIQEIRSNKIKSVKTCLVHLIFMYIGIRLSMPGSTLLDLQISVNCTLEQIGYLLPARAVGYGTGAVLAGFIPEKFDKQPLIIICCIISGISMGLIPWSKTPFLLPLIDEKSNSTLTYKPEDALVVYPYGFVALYTTIVALIFAIVLCVQKEYRVNTSSESEKDENVQMNTTTVTIAIIMGMLTAAYVMSVFWGTSTLFRYTQASFGLLLFSWV